jgi:hypothetical protein
MDIFTSFSGQFATKRRKNASRSFAMSVCRMYQLEDSGTVFHEILYLGVSLKVEDTFQI